MMNIETSRLLLAAPGATEMIIILLIIIVLFGAKKIPELARGLGKGIKEFKDAKEEGEKEVEIEDKKK